MGRKLVRKTNCCDQVDFCPFRGPDAPFALRRSYHEAEKIGSTTEFLAPLQCTVDSRLAYP